MKDQEKINRIVEYCNETCNEIDEGYQAVNDITKEHMLEYIKEIDFELERKVVEVCGDEYSDPQTILDVMLAFVKKEKKKFEKGSDRYDLLDTISKIIEE